MMYILIYKLNFYFKKIKHEIENFKNLRKFVENFSKFCKFLLIKSMETV